MGALEPLAMMQRDFDSDQPRYRGAFASILERVVQIVIDCDSCLRETWLQILLDHDVVQSSFKSPLIDCLCNVYYEKVREVTKQLYCPDEGSVGPTLHDRIREFIERMLPTTWGKLVQYIRSKLPV